MNVPARGGVNSATNVSPGPIGGAICPGLPLTPKVTVQLRAANGQCWDADYTTPITNDATEFNAKSD